MSYQSTWRDWQGREHETPVFIIGREKDHIEYLALQSIHKKPVKEITNVKPIQRSK